MSWKPERIIMAEKNYPYHLIGIIILAIGIMITFLANTPDLGLVGDFAMFLGLVLFWKFNPKRK